MLKKSIAGRGVRWSMALCSLCFWGGPQKTLCK